MANATMPRWKTRLAVIGHAEHAATDAAARQRLAKLAVPLLDELAALEQASYLLAARNGVEERIDELLRSMRGK